MFNLFSKKKPTSVEKKINDEILAILHLLVEAANVDEFFEEKEKSIIVQELNDGKIDFPCVETTACAFGGDKLERLFVTTGIHKSIEEENAGSVLVVDGLGAVGTKAFSFAG